MIAAERTVWEGILNGLESGRSGWLVTVLSTWGASPRLPGSVYVQWDDGAMLGSVSGGCIEDDLRTCLDQHSSAHYEVRGLTYGDQPGDRERFRLPCGGSMHLLAERLLPLPGMLDHVAGVVAAIAERQPVARKVDLSGSELPLLEREEAASGATLVLQSDLAMIHYGPPVRLLMIGAGPVAEALARLSLEAGLDVALCEPREPYRNSWAVQGVEAEAALPDDWLIARQPDERTAVVCLSHDPRVDDMALLAALKRPALLVGAMASARTAAARRERLAQLGLSPFEISRLESPLGISLGSRLPFEIAVSILGRILQLKNARQQQPSTLADWPPVLKQARA